jgi:hypothetical protein
LERIFGLELQNCKRSVTAIVDAGFGKWRRGWDLNPTWFHFVTA